MTLHASIYVFSFNFFHRKWDRKYPRPGVILRNILVLPKIKENINFEENIKIFQEGLLSIIRKTRRRKTSIANIYVIYKTQSILRTME